MKLEFVKDHGWIAILLGACGLTGYFAAMIERASLSELPVLGLMTFLSAMLGVFAVLARRPREEARIVTLPAAEPKVEFLAIPEAANSDDLLDIVLDNITIGIAVFDKDLTLQKWNSNYVEIMDMDEEALYVGADFAELQTLNFDKYANMEMDKATFVSGLLTEVRSLPTRRVERYFASGKIVEIISSRQPDGGFVASCKDITAARLAEQALKENEDRYRLMVDLSPDAIIAHKDGFIVYANEAALKLFRVNNRHNLIGQQIRTFFPFTDSETLAPYFGSAQDLQTRERLPTRKSKLLFPDGSNTDVEIDVSALLYGERRMLQLIIRDISAQIQIENFLRHAREEAEYAAQLKGAFLANMSHELRTPLNAVIGFSEVIINQLFGEIGQAKYLEYANDIRDSGLHLLELINDILDFSKIEAGEQNINEEDVEIDVLVSECVRLTRQRAIENDIAIKLEFDPFLPQLFADRRMLKQILINLLSNAIKFTPTGGRIVTSVQVIDDVGMKISVCDNGIGIREEDIVKAMTPFVQVDSEKSRKYHGTGLGLPLSKNLAELHSGSLELKSTYGEGTIACLTLPASRIRGCAA